MTPTTAPEVTTNSHVDGAAPLLERAAEQASTLTRRGLDALNETSQALRAQAHQAQDSTVRYIRDEPVKSVLIAAAAGAALMAVVSMLARSRD